MHNKNIKTVFPVKAIAPAGLELKDLKPMQVALFDENTQRTVSAPSSYADSRYSLVYKTGSTGNGGSFPDKKNLRRPIKSLEIGDISKIYAFDGASDKVKQFEAYLGYDGITDCKSLSFECGQTYQIHMVAQGKAIRDFMGGAGLHQIAAFTTDCCEDCSVDEAVKKSLDKAVAAINEQVRYMKEFFDVYPVYSCCPTPAPFPQVDFFDFCLEVCDTGDASALADVQIQYQDYNIYRASREGAISTYRTDCVLTAPADYVQTGNVLPNCDVCPAGYTTVAAAKKYIVTIDNAGTGTTPAQWLLEVQAAGAFSAATSANRLSRNGSVSVYEVLVPAGFVEPVAPIAETDFVFVADVPVSCVQTTPVNIAWSQCGQKYKITRKLCLTKRISDCGDAAADLLELQAAYANNPDIVPGSLIQTDATNCIASYEVEQYSPCIEDGCDWVGKDIVKFPALAGFDGNEWSNCPCEGWTVDIDGCPVAPPITVENCRGGLKFVSKNWEKLTVPCTHDYWSSNDFDDFRLEVSIAKQELEACEPQDVLWKVAQTFEGPRSTGQYWFRQEVESRAYDGYCYVGANHPNGILRNAAFGEVYGTNPEKEYNHVSIIHSQTYNDGRQVDYHANKEVIHLIVEAEKTDLLNQLKSLANSIAVAKNSSQRV